jgi:hypothetical protein
MQERWKTTTGCAIAAVVAAALFLAIHSKPDLPPATPAKSQPAIVAPKPIRPTEPTQVTASPGTAPKEVKFEVCGVDGQPHTVTAADASDIDMNAAETYDRWKTALINSPDAPARAVGLTLQRIDTLGSLAADTSLEQLVELATRTHDPTAYAIAVGICKTGFAEDVEPACRRLSLSDWTKLDPDNALPWVASAASARNNGDSWAESVAFARAAQAHKVDDYSQSSLSAASAAFPADTPPMERLAGEIRFFGVDAARFRPDIREISQYCSTAAIQQSQIHDQCDAMAELLVEHGGTLLNFGVGRSIGKRVGWPAARLEQMKQELDTLREFLFSNERKSVLSCEYMAWHEDFLKRRTQVGELAALRAMRDKQSSH